MDHPLLLAVAVLVLTLVSTPVALAMLRTQGVLDRPNVRSSHAMVVPRGGGIAPAAVMAGAIFFGTAGPARLVAATAMIFAVLGFADDVLGLGVGTRLVAQCVIAIIAAGALVADGGFAGWWLLMGPVLVVGHVNAFNFMDGINGISALHATVVGMVWAVAATGGQSWAVSLGLVLVAGSLGFLPYNFPHARVFLGDAGSYFLGGWVAVGAIVLSKEIGVLPAFLPLSIYTVDTAWTLMVRIHRGKSWREPHRDHVYQRLVRGGWSHASASLVVAGFTAALGLLALMGRASPVPTVVSAGVVLALYLGLPTVVDRQKSTRRPDPSPVGEVEP